MMTKLNFQQVDYIVQHISYPNQPRYEIEEKYIIEYIDIGNVGTNPIWISTKSTFQLNTEKWRTKVLYDTS